MWKRLAFPQQASVTPLSNVTWQEACGFASGVSGFTLVCVRFCVSTAPHSVNNLAFVVINTVSVVPPAVCLSHDCLGHLRYLVVLYKIGGIFFFYFCERCHWNFVKDCIESIADLCSMDTLILILAFSEYGKSFHLFVSFSVSFHKVLQFSEYRFKNCILCLNIVLSIIILIR